MFVGTQERKVEHDILRDMHQQLQSVRQEIVALRQAVEDMKAEQQTTQVGEAPAKAQRATQTEQS